MKLQSKWMIWQPSEKDEKNEVPKVPQGGFGTSDTQVSLHMRISRTYPLDWLNQWTMTRCVFRDRQWGGVKCLYRDYCRWSAEHESSPALEDEFIERLEGAGMILDSYGMVYGLVLEEDGMRLQ
jgi:hypothetical protein